MKAYTRELLRAKLLELTKLQREHDQTGASTNYFLRDERRVSPSKPNLRHRGHRELEIQSCIEGKETTR